MLYTIGLGMLPFRHYMGDKRLSTCIEGCTDVKTEDTVTQSGAVRGRAGAGERARKAELKMRIFRNTKAVEIAASQIHYVLIKGAS